MKGAQRIMLNGELPAWLVYRGELKILISQDPPDNKWHLSISHPRRYPTWDEIHDARYELLPDEITVAMFLPPKEQYVNVHPNCFHLHETDDREK